MRIAFLGNDPWSVPPLEALSGAEGIEVAVVITNPARPAGRGSRLTPTRVAEAGRLLQLSVVEADGVRTGPGAAALAVAEPDAVVVVAYGELLGPDTLGLAPRGAVNLHFSLLPRWRGASPVQRAILAGDRASGVTVMRMDEGLDTGPILARLETPIPPAEDAGTLGMRLAALGGALLSETLRDLEAGRIEPQIQDEGLATLAPRIAKHERSIDWTLPAETTARLVRALSPHPGATTRFHGYPLKVLEGEAVQGGAAAGAPGTVASLDGAGVVVATGDGGYRLFVVAPAGRRAMSSADWARGARLRPGDPVA